MPDADNLKEIMESTFANYIGPGSAESHTAYFKEHFPDIIKKYNIKSVNDAGCGLGWTKEVCEGIKYSGFDINKRDGATILDITEEIMPKADLIICRDVMRHLTNDLIDKTIKNFKESAKYLFATSDYSAANSIRPKKYNGSIINACVNLEKILGEPLEKIEETIDDRYMGLWKL